jgi:subtilisin-like proprotein convertase family protein
LGPAGKAGAQNELAIYLLNSNKNVIASSTTNTIGGDPFQNIQMVIPGDPNALLFDGDYIVVKLISGAAPHDMTYMFLGAGGGTVAIDNYDTQSPTLFGHAKAADAAGVGAVEYDESPSYFLTPPAPEFYSSAGGVPNYFDANGNRLSAPVVRQQPLFSSIDGTDNTFLGADLDMNGIPNFSGTSAAAPHAAAVAALMLQARPSLTSSQILTILEHSALPLDSGTGTPNVGYSFDGGWGLIQADKALAAVEPRTVSGIVYQDTGHVGHYVAGDPVAAGATVYMDITGSGHFVSGSRSIGTTTPLVIPFQTNPSLGPTRVSSPLTVRGVPGLITHLSVTLDITAVEDFNLGVTLVSPTGIRIPLIEQTGVGISNFPDVTLDDAGLDTVEDPGIFDFTGQVLEPDVKLAALIGENPNGTWHLEGRDFGLAPGADSTLKSWSLHIAYADPTATTNSRGNFTFTGPYLDANGRPIVGLAPAAYTGPITVGLQGFAGYSVQWNASTTTTALASSAATTTYGQSVTFTATVTSAAGGPTPTGNVSFYLDYSGPGTGTLLGQSKLSGGAARLTTTTLPAGGHTVTAVYAGATGLAGSTSPAVSQHVNPASASIALADSASGPIAYGTLLTFTATVTNTSGTSAVPTGVVKFLDGTTSLGQASLSGGKAVLANLTLTAGVHHVTAVYNSNANFTPVTSAAVSQQVNAARASISLADSASAPVPYGTLLTFTATVTNTSGTSAVPTGVVKFLDGATLLGQANLSSGKATFSSSTLAVGVHHVTAVYNSVSVGTNGAAFGVADGTVMTVIDILLAADDQAVDGVLDGGGATRRAKANTVFSAINQAGGR